MSPLRDASRFKEPWLDLLWRLEPSNELSESSPDREYRLGGAGIVDLLCVNDEGLLLLKWVEIFKKRKLCALLFEDAKASNLQKHIRGNGSNQREVRATKGNAKRKKTGRNAGIPDTKS
jgi:hypothetical protein